MKKKITNSPDYDDFTLKFAVCATILIIAAKIAYYVLPFVIIYVVATILVKIIDSIGKR